MAAEFADWNWSTVWEVRTRQHETGWSAEFAIPFQSLRYGAGDVQTWRVNFVVTGGFYNGRRYALSPYVNYRKDETFNAWARWNHNAIDLGGEEGSFTVTLVRAGFSYSFTPKVNLRALAQYNDDDDVFAANVRFSWLRSANAGLNLVYNEIDDRSGLGRPRREFVVKYSHTFDVL